VAYWSALTGCMSLPSPAIVLVGWTVVGEEVQPIPDALAGDPHRCRDVGLFPALAIPLHDQQPAMHSGAGIRVGHENLRASDGPSTSHTSLGGSHPFKPSRCYQPPGRVQLPMLPGAVLSRTRPHLVLGPQGDDGAAGDGQGRWVHILVEHLARQIGAPPWPVGGDGERPGR